jgi:hypothetical protein
MGHKQYRVEPLTDKEKARLRALNGVKARWAADNGGIIKPLVKTVRDYRETIDVKLPRRLKRGTSGCRLSHEKRVLILERSEKRTHMRAALQDVIDGRKKLLPL